MEFSYKHVLYGTITFASLLMALLKIGLFGNAISPPMAFFCGITYFVFVAWAAGQLYKMHTGEAREELDRTEIAAPLAAEETPDEETLFAAETYLSLGEDLDTVCKFVNPRYAEWDGSRKLAYRQGLRAL